MTTSRPIVVTAAIIRRDDAYFVTRRLRGTHLEGTWEFPGGKCEPGESHADCLRREIREELAADCRVGAEVFTVSHDYGDRVIELHFLACDLLTAPSAVLGQDMRWVARELLDTLEFPPADAELIAKLKSGGW